jgi:hypothetical protein
MNTTKMDASHQRQRHQAMNGVSFAQQNASYIGALLSLQVDTQDAA